MQDEKQCLICCGGATEQFAAENDDDGWALSNLESYGSIVGSARGHKLPTISEDETCSLTSGQGHQLFAKKPRRWSLHLLLLIMSTFGVLYFLVETRNHQPYRPQMDGDHSQRRINKLQLLASVQTSKTPTSKSEKVVVVQVVKVHFPSWRHDDDTRQVRTEQKNKKDSGGEADDGNQVHSPQTNKTITSKSEKVVVVQVVKVRFPSKDDDNGARPVKMKKQKHKKDTQDEGNENDEAYDPSVASLSSRKLCEDATSYQLERRKRSV